MMNTREGILLDAVGSLGAILASVVAALYFGQFTTALGQVVLYIIAGTLVVVSLPGLVSGGEHVWGAVADILIRVAFFKGRISEAERWIATLRSVNAKKRLVAAYALGELGDAQAVEPLIAVLKDENSDVRRQAVIALGKLGDERAVGPLISVLKDDDEYVRQKTAEALGQVSPPGAARAAESLIAILADENVLVQMEAAKTLGKLGDAAVEPLIAVLGDEDSEMRWRAAGVLGSLRNARAVEPLIDALSDEDLGVRRIAIQALGELGDRRALEPLTAALKDEDLVVRMEVAAALDRIALIEGDTAVDGLTFSIRDEEVSTHNHPAITVGPTAAQMAREAERREEIESLLSEIFGLTQGPERLTMILELLSRVEIGDPDVLERLLALAQTTQTSVETDIDDVLSEYSEA